MPSDDAQHTRLRLEIAHVLFLDIVGYSKLLIDEQREALQQLNEIVRKTEAVREAEARGGLVRLPTGDGMALAFTASVEEPVECALEISRALGAQPTLPLRMGVHSGPVQQVEDVNARANIAGAGINLAQRVMDCGDAGHILLSERVADDLAQARQWRAYLHDLGECEVKHGIRVGVTNLYGPDFGNAAQPSRLRTQLVAAKGRAFRRRQIALVGAVAIATIVLAVLYWHHLNRSKEEKENRIAILPFRPLVPEEQDPALEIGMADSLITKLSNSRQLIVPSLSSVRSLGALDAVSAGRALGVASVLEGNLHKSGDRLRVTARLIQVANGASLWAETFNEKFTDVFAVQETISRKVTDALALRLNGREKERIGRHETENVDAYQLYLTGRYHWNKLTPPEIMKSIEFFQRAIELDPNYALAHFGLAEAYRSLSVTSDGRPSEILPASKSAALRAVALDEGMAEAHASLVFNYIWFDWDWSLAEREAKRAIELNPNSGFVRFANAHFLSDIGRHDAAIAEVRRARELEPTSLIINTLEGAFLYHARHFQEAEQRLRKALELEPHFWVAHFFLGGVQAFTNRFAEAQAEFAQARDLSFGNSQAVSMLGYVCAQRGDSAQTRALLEELRGRSGYVPSANIAHLYHALGENDEAFAWLEKGMAEHDVFMSFLKVDPKWDALRGDPRFASLLQRLGFD